MSDDGISLVSSAHPIAPWWRRVIFWFLTPYRAWRLRRAAETVEIEIRGQP